MMINLSLNSPEDSPFDFDNVQAAAKILRTIANELTTYERAGLKPGDGGPVFDDNGKLIGYWKVTEGSLEAAELGGS